jgi:hypothetical protein
MKISRNIKYIIIGGFVLIILRIINSKLKEGFDPNALLTYDSNSPKNSHNVDVVNNEYSCSNFCGPTARCSVTGQQCFADIDCPGCQPNSPPLPKTKNCIPGNNDAGKLTPGLTPTYSSLTSGYGTRERIITKDMYARPPQANFGYDTWGESFNEGQKLFNKRYKPNQTGNMPNYPPMYSMTGEFIGDGPLPSNY